LDLGFAHGHVIGPDRGSLALSLVHKSNNRVVSAQWLIGGHWTALADMKKRQQETQSQSHVPKKSNLLVTPQVLISGQ